MKGKANCLQHATNSHLSWVCSEQCMEQQFHMLPNRDRLLCSKISSIGLATFVGVCRSSSVLLGLSVECTLHTTGILARTEALLLSTLCTGQLHTGVHNYKPHLSTRFHCATVILLSFVINGKHMMYVIVSKDVIVSAGNA